MAYRRYSTTEFWSNVKQIYCQIDESVTLYLIKSDTQLYCMQNPKLPVRRSCHQRGIFVCKPCLA
ncbi:hypothetical protein ED818_16295 [Escherichia coli]|nr:hypothetical protein [Escherichia coli]